MVKVDIELLVLGALRVLGSGCSFDIIEELSNVDEVTHRNFLHFKFCKWGRGLSKLISQEMTKSSVISLACSRELDCRNVLAPLTVYIL